MAIIYRMSTAADEPALIQFWVKHSGWDTLSQSEWEHRFLNTPLGPATFSLAIEDETKEIIAQIAYMPVLISVAIQEILSYRPMAVIVNQNHRNINSFGFMQRLIIKMYLMSAENFKNSGVELLYMLPDPRWTRFLKFFPNFQTAVFPLWSLKFPILRDINIPIGYDIDRITANDPRIDTLWGRARQTYNCIIVRDKRTLPWKMSHGDYIIYGVCFKGNLVGLFSYIKKKESNQWLLSDLMAKDNDSTLQATLQTACYCIMQEQSGLSDDEKSSIRKIAVLATPTMEQPLQSLGFAKDNYNFMLAIHLLKESIPKTAIDPRLWYLSAND